MTIDEAKKAGFRVFGGTNATAIVWEVMRACCISNYEKLVSNLGPDDFPTRAKARDELKRRKAEASEKRVEARVAARKAAGTQVPPPETPEQRDTRLKALYESYCKQGGPITKEQLTEEMRYWLRDTNKSFWGFDDATNELCRFEFSTITWYPTFPAFWNCADAEHDHFLRTWKGRLTGEIVHRNIRRAEHLYEAVVGKTYSVWTWCYGGSEKSYFDEHYVFLSESEAKNAAHDLWLADRRKNQMTPITLEQAKALREGDEFFYLQHGGGAPKYHVTLDKLNRSPDITKWKCFVNGLAYFTHEAALAALDKNKGVASHETPVGETQAEKVSTGETQTVLEEAMKCVGGPRRRDYGTPDENFGRIADLWNVHLKDKLAKPMTPGDVAMMMILLKVARQANSPKRDNLVDIAGYAQCASELKEGK